MLGLLHMALSHVRNVEIFALLLPIVMLHARIVAVRLAAGLAWQGGGPGCFNGDARGNARRCDLGNCDQQPRIRLPLISRLQPPWMR